MNRKEYLDDDPELLDLYNKLQALQNKLGEGFIEKWNRLLPFADLLNDRWDKAKKLGFGEETNVYDSAIVMGHVQVGSHCWIGPNTLLDGSGNLVIGNWCTVSAGVQIYTHDNVLQTLTSGKQPIERAPVTIGNNVYIGPNALITKGVRIGNNVVIGAFALVNKDVPENSIVFGQPASVKGTVDYKSNN